MAVMFSLVRFGCVKLWPVWIKENTMSVKDELELIRSKHCGLLRPEDVVAFARNPETALHKRFVWDDGEAAAKYRLWQARQVISAVVTVPPSRQQTVRAYVSLPSDRSNGNGYRSVGYVLSKENMRTELLRKALDEAKRWRDRYRHLKELVPVFDAINNVSKVA